MQQFVHLRRQVLVLAAMLFALTGIAGVCPAGASSNLQGLPPVNIDVIGATTVAPGGTLSFAGNCLPPGGPQEAFVHAYLVPGQGFGPFDFWVTVTANPNGGAFSGTIAVPSDAPNGTYALNLDCGYLDMSFARDDTPASFTVDGPQIATTTTTTTTSPTTTTTVARSGLTATPVSEPAPARPLSGAAALTG